MLRKLKQYIIILLCICTNIVSAQNNTPIFRGITMSDGLSDLLVNAIYKDSMGYVWIGTDNSLDRFDGVKIKHFAFTGNDLKNKRVNVISENGGYIYVGNNSGLWRMSIKTEILEQIFYTSIDCPVYSFRWHNQTLYIGTEKGLFIVQNENITCVNVSNNLFANANHVHDLAVDDNGIVWLATSEGLHAYNPQDNSILPYYFQANGLHAAQKYTAANKQMNNFRNMTRIGKTLYIGTWEQGIIEFNTDTQIFKRGINVGCSIISDISSDGQDLVYVATDGNGICTFSHKSQQILLSHQHNPENNESIRSNSVYSLLVDKDGIIWIGFYQSGLDYTLQQSGFFNVYSFNKLFESRNMQVRSFLLNDNQKLIGTRDGLYLIDETAQIVKNYTSHDLRSNLILSLGYYNGEYYIGTYGGGLYVVSPKTYAVRQFAGIKDEVFKNGHIFCITTDKHNNIWFGTSSGLYRYNGQTFENKSFTNKNSQLLEGNVFVVFFDSSEKGWIATSTGLCIYDQASDAVKTNIFPEGFINNQDIRNIYEDSKHNIYFAPRKGELFKSNLSMTEFIRIPMNMVLRGNSFMSMIEDNGGWMWFGCDAGIFRMRDENSSIYSFSDGVIDPTFTDRAAYKDANGILWFGNAKGLLYVNPEKVDTVCRHPYKLRFTDILVNGVSINNKQANTISKFKYKQNNLSFECSDFSYILPGHLILKYKLEGYDSDWNILYGRNELQYFNLPCGTYKMCIRIPGNEANEVSFKFRIASPFSWWLLLIIAITVAAIGWLIKWLWKRMRSAEQIIEHENEKEIDDEKYKNSHLSDKKCEAMYIQLQKCMKTQKPYINSDLKLSDLAEMINVSSHSLSYLFNQHLKQNYYDFINEYRICEFKKYVTEVDLSRYTLSALAEKCGFSSRTTFFRTFKKYTGVTPNEYVRSIGKTIDNS